MEHYLARRGHFLTVTLNGSDQVVEGPDFNRVSIVFPSAAHSYQIGLGTSTANDAFLLPAAGPAFIIDKAAIGDKITGEIHLKGTNADTVTLWIGTY